MCMAARQPPGRVFSAAGLTYDFAWPPPRSRCSISTATRLTTRPSTSFISRPSPRAPRSTTGRSARGDGLDMNEVEGLRSEEHTSELQSLRHLVCRLLLEKKKSNTSTHEDT